MEQNKLPDEVQNTLCVGLIQGTIAQLMQLGIPEKMLTDHLHTALEIIPITYANMKEYKEKNDKLIQEIFIKKIN